jgi:hypothetical protein
MGLLRLVCAWSAPPTPMGWQPCASAGLSCDALQLQKRTASALPQSTSITRGLNRGSHDTSRGIFWLKICRIAESKPDGQQAESVRKLRPWQRSVITVQALKQLV